MADDQSEARTDTDIGDPPVEAFPISRDLRWLVIGGLVLAAAAIGATLALLADGGSPPTDAQGALAATETATTAETPPVTETEQTAPAEEETVVDESASEVQSQSTQTQAQPDEEASQAQAQADPTGDPAQAQASAEADAAEESTDLPDSEAQAGADQPEPEPEPDPATAPIADAILALGPFSMPITGACFPDFAGQLPGAPRAYRNGVHEGVDFYPGWACASIELGTPVLAVGEGRVIRADWNYDDLTTDAYFAMKARGFTGPGRSGHLPWPPDLGAARRRRRRPIRASQRHRRGHWRGNAGGRRRRAGLRRGNPARPDPCAKRAARFTCTSSCAWITATWAKASRRRVPSSSTARSSPQPPSAVCAGGSPRGEPPTQRPCGRTTLGSARSSPHQTQARACRDQSPDQRRHDPGPSARREPAATV